MQWRVIVEIPLKKTEEETIVLELINKIVDPDEVTIEDSGIDKVVIAKARCLSSLSKLFQALRRERILDATRKRLKSSARGDHIVFMLHKQALAAGRVSLVDDVRESPLGAITIRINYPDPMRVIDWLAPPTVQGKPKFQGELPENNCTE